MALPEEGFLAGRRKVWKTEVATENFKVYNDYNTHAMIWRKTAQKMEDARYGIQFSKAEEEMILRFRQAPLPISASTAICDTADALMLSAKPSIYVAPISFPHDKVRDEMSRQVSRVYTTLLEKSWYDSLGNLQFDRAVQDYTNVGHGLLFARPKREFGEFNVEFSHLPWRYFYGDPSSIDPLYRDMDNMIYAMPVSQKFAYRFVKSIEPDITMQQFEDNWLKGGLNETNFEEDKTYNLRSARFKDMPFFCVRYSLEEETVFIVSPKSSKDINRGDSANQLDFRTFMHRTEAMDRMEAEGLIRIDTQRRFYLSEYTSIGNLGYRQVYPVTQYNIVPMLYDHRGTPYPYSRMWHIYPLQRAVNRFVMSAILNNSLLNSTRIIAEKDSLINYNQWISNASMPGAVLEYDLVTPGSSVPPVVVEAKPMTDAWLQFPRWLVYMMEYISGIYSTMMGDASNAPDVFSTLASLQSAGGMKIKRRMAAADATLSVLGEVAGEYYKEYAPLNGFSTLFKPEDSKEETVNFNELDIGEDDKGDPTAFVIPSTDLRKGFRSVRFVSRGSSGYESATEASLLTLLATQLKIPQLAKAVIKRINLKDADDIMKEIDENAQLKAENQQLSTTAEKLTRQHEVNMRQIEQAAINLSAAQVKGQLGKELEKFKANPAEYLRQTAGQEVL